MTKLLDYAVERVRALPDDEQDEFAHILLSHFDEHDDGVYHLTAEEVVSLEKSRAQAARGEFATDEEVRAVWAKFGL